MVDTSEPQSSPTPLAASGEPTNTATTNPQAAADAIIDPNSQPDSANKKNVECQPSNVDTADSSNKSACESSNDLTSKSQIDATDQANNSVLSDQAKKSKSKLLESETEQRNTSTSNAGESEYESANEEDIADFDNTPDDAQLEVAASAAAVIEPFENSAASSNEKSTTTTTFPSSDVKSETQQNAKVEFVNENFDKSKSEVESDESKRTTLAAVNAADADEFSSVHEEEEEEEETTNSNSNELEDELPEQEVLKRIRRRKRRTKVSDDDDENIIDDDELDEDDDEVMSDDEEATEDIEDEEDSFDEAEEGQIADSKSADGVTSNKSLPEDERENGDGQESENHDSKSAKTAKVASAAKKGEIEDKRNPQYIPRKGPFYEHDDRMGEEDAQERSSEPATEVGEENDAEKLKSKKRLMATMKLRSDEMDDEVEAADKLSSKSVSKEKIHQDVSSAPSAESLEKAVSGGAKGASDLKSSRETLKKKPIWDSKDRWSHDKFNLDDQKPKSREELINAYGYDIRNENEAPKLQRRSKYGKGPQKYSRRSEDETAYAKKTLRKVILRSPRESRSEDVRTAELRESGESQSNVVVKKDQVFNNRHSTTPKDRKVISKEQPAGTSKLGNSSGKLQSNFSTDSANTRVHENRVFVNKSGQSSKFNNKNDARDNRESILRSNNQEQFKDGGSKFNDTNVHNKQQQQSGESNEKSKELFTNDDFPELVSTSTKTQATTSATTAATANDPSNKNKIIYYSNSIAPNNAKPVNKDTHHHYQAKESNYESEPKSNQQPVPVVKSQLYENSRFSRSRNYGSNHEYSNSNWNNSNSSSNNNRSVGPGKSQPQIQHHQQQQYTSGQQQIRNKQPPPSSVNNFNKDEHMLSDQQNEMANSDSRPKRYSSIRQQRNVPVSPQISNTSNNISTAAAAAPTQPTSTYTPVSQAPQITSAPPQQHQPQQPQYISLNADGTGTTTTTTIIPAEVTTKNSYYDPTAVVAATNELPAHQGAALIPNTAGHHHQSATVAAHNYATINGPGTGATGATAAPHAGTTYIPTATPLMAYYDPNSANTQAAVAAAAAAGTTTTALGLTQAYFTTDQTGTAQTAPNYYLTTADLTAVAYHPAYHLQTNYPQPLPSHHSHQSHVANRYLNTTPANAPSAESNRYLQTVPTTQNSAQILVTGQAYQPTMQTAFPSGYPQFPPAQSASTPAMGTASSPLPAGYPNVPIGNSSTSGSSVATGQQQTPSGYPELYRGGITYYDIQSQQQAMQRQLQQNVNQQSRRGKGGVDSAPEDANVDGKGAKHHSATKNEISVGN